MSRDGGDCRRGRNGPAAPGDHPPGGNSPVAPPIAMGSHEFGSVEMRLTLRATQTDGDRLDFTVYEAGKQVGRIYENVGTLEGSWCWSVTIDVIIYVAPVRCNPSATINATITVRDAGFALRVPWS